MDESQGEAGRIANSREGQPELRRAEAGHVKGVQQQDEGECIGDQQGVAYLASSA